MKFEDEKHRVVYELGTNHPEIDRSIDREYDTLEAALNARDKIKAMKPPYGSSYSCVVWLRVERVTRYMITDNP